MARVLRVAVLAVVLLTASNCANRVPRTADQVGVGGASAGGAGAGLSEGATGTDGVADPLGAGETGGVTEGGEGGGVVGGATDGPGSNAAPGGDAGAPEGASDAAGGGDGSPIVLGAVFHRTGPISFLGQPCYEAVTAWVADVNERGGVQGRQIRYVAYDDEGNPQRTPGLVRRLIEQDKVDAIVGFCADNGLEASRSVIDAAGMPVLGPPIFGSPLWFDDPLLFPVVGFTNAIWAHNGAADMKRRGFTKGGQIYTDCGACEIGAKHVRRFMAQYGVEMACDIAVGVAETDYSAAVSRCKSAGAQGLLMVIETGAFYRAARSLNYYPVLYGPWTSYIPETLALSSPEVDKSLLVQIPHLALEFPRSNEGRARFTAAMEKHWKGRGITSQHIQGWITGEVFEEVMRRIGSEPFTKENFMAALRTFQRWEGTFNSPLTFGNGANIDAALCQQMLAVAGGKWKLYDPSTPLHCAPESTIAL